MKGVSHLPAKLTTTISNIDAKVNNQVNRDLIRVL
jgi:hypothetical protein